MSVELITVFQLRTQNFALKTRQGVRQQPRVQRARLHTAVPGLGIADRLAGLVHSLQQSRQIEPVGLGVAAPNLVQQIGAADDLIERMCAERGQYLAYLLSEVQEEVAHLLRRAVELGAQLG